MIQPLLRRLPILVALLFSLSLFGQLSDPIVTGNTTVCLNSSAILSASDPGGDPEVEFRWYRDPLLGADVLIDTRDTIVLGPFLVSGLQNYKVESYKPSTGETSARIPISITVSLATNVDAPVALPSDLILCFGASTDVTASSLLGNTQFRWYDALTEGNLLSTDNPYNTGPLTLLPTIYVTSVDGSGCESPRVVVPALTLLPAVAVPVPVAQNPIICNSDSAVMYLTNKPGGSTVHWYDALLGGNLLYTGDTLVTNESNTGLANLVSTYYAEIEDANGCRSLRVPVIITKLPAVDVPLVDNPVSIICSGDSVSITASSLLGGVTFNWYDALLGGNLIHTGATYNSGPLVNGGALDLVQTLYVTVLDGNGCESIRIPVVITTLPAIDLPLVDPLVAQACANDSVDFTATSLLGNNKFYWYDAITGGTLLDSGATFNTGAISNNSALDLTTIFYVESRDDNGCRSLRAPATIITLPLLDVPVVTPILPAICSGDSVEFTAAGVLGASEFYWYNDLLGGSPIDSGSTFNTGAVINASAIDLSRTYFVEAVDANGCRSLRIPVELLIKPALDVPIANPPVAIVCAGESVDIEGTSLLGSSTFNWYDQLLGTTPIYTGDIFSTPPASNNTGLELVETYYLEAEDATGCKSLRTPVVITVRPALDLPLVDPPLALICNGADAEFTASSLLGSADFNWYDAILGGNQVATGATFNTGTIENNTGGELTQIYSVEAVDTTGCTSLRVPVTVVVRPALDVPLATPLLDTICSGNEAEFTASSLLGSAREFYWYDVPLGGTPLDTGAVFNTGEVTNTSTIDLAKIYYVELEDTAGCRSLRTPVTLVILPALDIPIVVPPVELICNGQSAEFVASTLLGTDGTFNWYDDLLQGNLLAQGDTFTTAPLQNQGTTNLAHIFFVEFENNDGCKSLRTPVTALVRPALEVPLADPPLAVICTGDSVTFTGSTVLGLGPVTFRWYDQLFGGNELASGFNFNTGAIQNTSGTDLTQIYYLEAEDTAGCRSLRTPATVIVRPALDVPIANPITQLICNGDSAEITATSVGALLGAANNYHWYEDLLGGTPIFSGDTFNTGAIQNSSPTDLVKIYYVEVEDTAGCRSLRTPATVITRPALDVPLVDPLVALACNGDSVEFTASSLLGSAQNYHWYNALVGGTKVAEGETINTGPIINAGTTDLTYILYVELEDTNGCRSIRTPATVISAPAIDVPIANPPLALICNKDSAVFTATSLLGFGNGTFRWYDDLLQGSLIHEGDTFSTGPITNNSGLDITELYYVEVVDSNGCTSLRTPVTTIVRPSLIPPVPTVVDAICSGNKANLSAASVLQSGNITWYEDLTSESAIFEGPNYTTEVLFNTGVNDIIVDYWVSYVDSVGCESARLPIEVVVTPGPAEPNVTPMDQTICDGDHAEISASGAGLLEHYNWFTSDNPTTPAFVGADFNTGALFNEESTDSTYLFFVEIESDLNCRSRRGTVTVNVLPEIEDPEVEAIAEEICSGDQAVLFAFDNNQVGSYHWYVDTTSLSPFFIGDTLITNPIVNTNPTTPKISRFFVKFVVDNGCESRFSFIDIITFASPDKPTLSSSASAICEGETVFLSADNIPVGFDVLWYASGDINTPVGQGQNYETGALVNDTIIIGKLVSSNGCESEAATISISTIPGITLDEPSIICKEASTDSIFFQWSAIINAEGYELSTDNGATWFQTSTPQLPVYIAIKTGSETEITLSVRAYQNTQCGDKLSSTGTTTCEFVFVPETDPLVEIFNSFSPNGDGSNDFWYIADDIGLYPDNKVAIFNRWGKEVYSTTGYDNKNNVFNGEDLEDGAYFYTIEIPSENYKSSGYVMIIR